MPKVLVADDKTETRDSLAEILRLDGYEVVVAKDGGEAFELTCHERPDVVLLDIGMPVMDGFQVLRRLRENPSTKDVPVVLLTGLDPIHGERLGMDLGVTHYITKPYSAGVVETAIRAALREARGPGVVEEEAPSTTSPAPLKAIGTGIPPIDKVLSGGIPLGSLSLVEGAPGTGKSVLCHHFADFALKGGLGVAYYVAPRSVDSIVDGMTSLGLAPVPYVRAGQLAFYPMEQPAASEPRSDAGRWLSLLADGVERLPEQYRIAVLDHVTDLASRAAVDLLMDFFVQCRGMCDDGRTIIIVARSYGFEKGTLARLEEVCDAHLRVGTDKLGGRLVKVLEVLKVLNTTMTRDNIVNFDVDPEEGLRVVPGARVRV